MELYQKLSGRIQTSDRLLKLVIPLLEWHRDSSLDGTCWVLCGLKLTMLWEWSLSWYYSTCFYGCKWWLIQSMLLFSGGTLHISLILQYTYMLPSGKQGPFDLTLFLFIYNWIVFFIQNKNRDLYLVQHHICSHVIFGSNVWSNEYGFHSIILYNIVRNRDDYILMFVEGQN